VALAHFYWPPAQAVLENATRNRLATAYIVCPCTSGYTCVIELPRESYIYYSVLFIERLCDIIWYVINICDDTLYNFLAYM